MVSLSLSKQAISWFLLLLVITNSIVLLVESLASCDMHSDSSVCLADSGIHPDDHSTTTGSRNVMWDEETILRSFLSDHIDAICPHNLFPLDLSNEPSTVSTQDRVVCIEKVKKLHNSVKLVSYYRKIDILTAHVATALMDPLWVDKMEGNTLLMRDKEMLFQRLSNDKRVKTICEIGFNAGYSATNFLTANPTASFISFDLFEHRYAPISARYISGVLFPERDIVIIAGNSSQTVPAFYNTLKQQRERDALLHTANVSLCNLIFIDGGHSKSDFLSDFYAMQRLADPSFHILIIDDVDQEEVGETLRELQYQGAQLENVVTMNNIKRFDGTNWVQLEDGSFHITHSFYDPDDVHRPRLKKFNVMYGNYKIDSN